MLATREIVDLLRHVTAADAKLVLTGEVEAEAVTLQDSHDGSGKLEEALGIAEERLPETLATILSASR